MSIHTARRNKGRYRCIGKDNMQIKILAKQLPWYEGDPSNIIEQDERYSLDQLALVSNILYRMDCNNECKVSLSVLIKDAGISRPTREDGKQTEVLLREIAGRKWRDDHFHIRIACDESLSLQNSIEATIAVDRELTEKGTQFVLLTLEEIKNLHKAVEGSKRSYALALGMFLKIKQHMESVPYRNGVTGELMKGSGGYVKKQDFCDLFGISLMTAGTYLQEMHKVGLYGLLSGKRWQAFNCFSIPDNESILCHVMEKQMKGKPQTEPKFKPKLRPQTPRTKKFGSPV